MDPFVMEVAGVPVQVEPLFETTAAYCREYLSEKTPIYTISVWREDLFREQDLLDMEADEEGLKRRKFSDMFLERSLIQRRVAEFLTDQDVLLMHGSTVAVDGQAYLFTAACGTGKSTHTRLWMEVFGERAMMVNDDKPFLKLFGDGVLVYGSPWTGKHGLGRNVCYPLNGICILKRGPENKIHRIAPEEAVDMLRHQSFQSMGYSGMVFAILERLIKLIPLWQMECNRDPAAAWTAWQAMSGGTGA